MEKQSRLMMWLMVLVLIVGAVLAIIPPQDKLKGGIDLAGGFSLLYEIDTTGLEGSEIRAGGGLASRVKEILQKRVDPNAQLNLIWRPIGNTRLEIQMPRPPRHARERRENYEEVLGEIRAKNVGRLEIELALSAAAESGGSTLDGLIRGVQARADKLVTLAKASNAFRAVRDGADIDAEETARQAYEEAFDAVLKTSLDPGHVTELFRLDSTKERNEQVGAVKEAYPDYADLIDDAEGKFMAWTEEKATLEDPSDLKRLIRGAGVLEFRILPERDSTNPSMIRSDDDPSLRQPIQAYLDQLEHYGPRPKAGDRYRWFEMEDPVAFLYLDSRAQLAQLDARTQGVIVSQYAGKWYVLSHAESKFGLLKDSSRKWKLKSALFQRDQNGRPCVAFTLDPIGGQLFGKLTESNLKRQLCIMLDDSAMSSATINSRITQRGQIAGESFTPEKVQQLIQTLEAGSLPGRLKETPLQEKNIGPSLGKTNRELGIRAAVYGLISVAGFILVYYMFAGLVANIALALNLLFVLGIMATMQATFTLPGIAGLILTVGMAVDANVLIFERIREEREKGTAFKRALKLGYEKALSTIIDANLTTLITCVVLGYVGSEEVKGFAMTLGFGIVSSMFTSLFVTRLIFITLMDRGWLKDLKMFKLIGRPSINWVSLRTRFWPVSLVLVTVGIGSFVATSVTDSEAIYDIEFLGGTSVQIELQKDTSLNDEGVRSMITSDEEGSAASWLRSASTWLVEASISQGDSANRFVVSSDKLTGGQIAALLQAKQRGQKDALMDRFEGGGIAIEGNLARFDIKTREVKTGDDEADQGQTVDRSMTLDEFKTAVGVAASYASVAADNLGGARIQTVSDVDDKAGESHAYEIITVETNKELVQAAVVAAMGDMLTVERPVGFTPVRDAAHPEGFYPIDDDAHYLTDVIGTEANFDVRQYKGGVALLFDELDPPQRVSDIQTRVREIRLQPGYEQYKWREYGIFGLASHGGQGEDEQFTRIALVVVDQDLPYYEDVDRWREEVALPEMEQATQALQSEKTLRKVVQFAPQVAAQTKNQAIISIFVALLAIVTYVWIRFGSMRYGLAAIVALVHDVGITLGLITLSDFFQGGAIGSMLLIQDFKIDLAMIAAMLTIIGYSLNDTIVVFDRIRDNRGKMSSLTDGMINDSINQTLSRTLLTSATTFIVVAILYFVGGPGVHGFAYALVVGVIVGTYSSVGIAAPLLRCPAVLNLIVYVLLALGLVGVVSVASESTLVTSIVGGITAIALAIAISKELGTKRSLPAA